MTGRGPPGARVDEELARIRATAADNPTLRQLWEGGHASGLLSCVALVKVAYDDLFELWAEGSDHLEDPEVAAISEWASSLSPLIAGMCEALGMTPASRVSIEERWLGGWEAPPS